MTVSERKTQLDRELKRIVARLKRSYHPEQVVVFGSYAQGQTHAWSDLDLMIVKRTRKPFIARSIEAARIARPKVGVDFVVYTPQELERLRREGQYFVREIDRGTVLYDHLSR